MDTARRDLTHGAIHSPIEAFFKQSSQHSKNLMKLVESYATKKRGRPFDTARRDPTHGAIHSLIDALFKQSL